LAGAGRNLKMPDLDKSRFVELIPELKDWNNGGGIDIDSWIQCEGDHKHLIGYARFFWPSFIEHDQCVFFHEGFDKETYLAFMARHKNDRTAVEMVMNHVHVLDLFSRSHHEMPTESVVSYIGRQLKEIWGVKLQHDFPDRRFVVSFPEDKEADITQAEITFFQAR